MRLPSLGMSTVYLPYRDAHMSREAGYRHRPCTPTPAKGLLTPRLRTTLPGVVWCWTSTGLLAAESAEKKLSPLSAQSLLETGGGLMLILLLIIGGAWLFKRYGRLPIAGRGMVNVLGGASVGPRERILLVKVENTRLLVGVAPGQVRTLHVLEADTVGEASFATQLNQVKQGAGGESLQ